jgi:hypothetical protein
MGKPRGRGERERTRQGGCPLRFALQRFNDSTLYRFIALSTEGLPLSAFQFFSVSA